MSGREGTPRLRTSLHAEGSRARLAIAGELDLATASQARAALARAEALAPELLLVDLSGLEHLDSSGVAMLYSASERARAAGRRLALATAGR